MKKKVYIQYNCVAHYRARIFELLSNNNDYDFTVVADRDADTPFMVTIGELDGRSINQIEAKTYKITMPKVPTLYIQPKALYHVFKDRPDLVIALGSPYSITAWMLLILCKIINVPVLLWGHGLLGGESGVKWHIRKFFYKMASGQLLYGDYAKKLLTEKGVCSEDLFVVYNSLDYDNQLKIYKKLTAHMKHEFRNGLGVKKDARLLVFTGRLQPVKRLDMIINAVGLLCKKDLDVHVAFIGDGQQKQFLEELSIKNNVRDKVHFLGASYDEDYLGLVLGSSDLCVIPSGAGLSIMHSLIFGTPVLIHDEVMHHFPEWEAVVENETGLYYKYNDIDDLASKIETALFPQPIKENIEEKCIEMISKKYNPHMQEKVFVNAVSHYINK